METTIIGYILGLQGCRESQRQSVANSEGPGIRDLRFGEVQRT